LFTLIKVAVTRVAKPDLFCTIEQYCLAWHNNAEVAWVINVAEQTENAEDANERVTGEG
jgi:hypothetical protein